MRPEFEQCWNKLEKMAKQLDVAIVGIGSCEEGTGSGTYLRIMKQAGLTYRDLQSARVIGEICNRPYDTQGADRTEQVLELLYGRKQGQQHLHRVVTGVGLDVLQGLVEHRKKVVAVAGGEGKKRAIRVALQQGFVNILVTDTKTAEELCENGSRPSR